MLDVVELPVSSRDKTLRAKHLLKTDFIPVEYYGNGVENQSFQVDYQTFRRVYRKAGGNTVVSLKIDGGKDLNVLVHEVKYDPVTDQIVHVDVVNVKMGQKLKTSIPLEFTGLAPAVKELGGILTTHLDEVEVECLPKDLVHSIEVDISSLVDFNSVIKVGDLVVPSTIELLQEADELVMNCAPPREEEVEEEGDAVDASMTAEDAAKAKEEAAAEGDGGSNEK
ncbi:50S ribosomal protein L25 [Candidatus Peregrinibacteria bacterium HGW-Peregrinibacteria-1]|jgi:large subunit ribosomal protein L25|nr:MAG: 50S ribosomal protein L25 [Candidatus Peregrinibacteria bacterium HGW-Peregrinibacteria-1]